MIRKCRGLMQMLWIVFALPHALLAATLSTALRHASVARTLHDAGAGWLEACRLAPRVAPIMGGATWLNDLRNNLVFTIASTNSIQPQALTATTTGAAVDLAAADGECFAIVFVGAVTGTTPTLTVTFTESATSGGTYTAIANADAHTQVTASNNLQILNFKRSLRFVKAVATIGGTTPSFTMGVAIFGMKKAV